MHGSKSLNSLPYGYSERRDRKAQEEGGKIIFVDDSEEEETISDAEREENRLDTGDLHSDISDSDFEPESSASSSSSSSSSGSSCSSDSSSGEEEEEKAEEAEKQIEWVRKTINVLAQIDIATITNAQEYESRLNKALKLLEVIEKPQVSLRDVYVYNVTILLLIGRED